MFQSPPVHQVIPKDVDSPFINALLVCERLQTCNRIYNEEDSDDATRLLKNRNVDVNNRDIFGQLVLHFTMVVPKRKIPVYSKESNALIWKKNQKKTFFGFEEHGSDIEADKRKCCQNDIPRTSKTFWAPGEDTLMRKKEEAY
ncbi:hypothetical protein KQX54_016398 [Cotesia glomerata]|uniref:Uncharacterized protein n=1 Tax=Cotesia glomerata TaxID=32391 RepID=A0AAV7IE22_COTGL|nr:hypothetical protein KQX54_016398 [Cotesia glomerata]